MSMEVVYEWLGSENDWRKLVKLLGACAGLATTASIARYLLKVIFAAKEKKYPSLPMAKFPQGHVPQMMRDSTSHFGNTIERLRRINPDIFNLPAAYFHAFFFSRALMVFKSKEAKEIFVQHGANTSDRPASVGVTLHNDNNIKFGMLGKNFKIAKHNRRIFLNQVRILGKDKMNATIDNEAKFVVKALAETNGKVFDPDELLIKAVCNVVSSLIFGSRFDYDDHEISIILDAVQSFNKNLVIVPWFMIRLNKLFNFMPKQTAKQESCQLMKDFVKQKIMNRLKDRFDAANTNSSPICVIDAYLDDLIAENPGAKGFTTDDLDAMVTIIFELFFAGTETTSTTLNWMLACFASDHGGPELQDRIFRDLEQLTCLPIDEHDNNKLQTFSFEELKANQDTTNVFNAAISEIQRFSCITMKTFKHVVNKDITLSSGHQLNAKEEVVLSIYSLHYDQEVWNNPYKFDVNHFLDENENYKKNDNFLPYGLGPRVCLGEKIADMEIKMFFGNIIKNFRIEPSQPGCIDLTVRRRGITSMPDIYSYKFIPRSSLK